MVLGWKSVSAFSLTFLTYLSVHAVRKTFTVAKSDLTTQYGWTPGFLGGLDTTFMFCYAIGNIGSGRLGDIFPPRVVLLIGALVAACSVTLTGFWPMLMPNMFSAILIIWAINGFAQSATYPTCIKLLQEWFDKSVSGSIYGLWSVCIAGGNIVGGLLAAIIIQTHMGVSAMFYLPSLLLCASAFVLFFFFPKNNHVQIKSKSSEQSISLLEILRIPNVMLYANSYFFCKSINYFMFFWLPYFFHYSKGFSQDIAAYISVSYDVGQIVGPIALGILSDCTGRRNMLICSFMALSIFVILLLKFVRMGLYPVCVLTLASGALIGGPAQMISTAVAADLGNTQHGNAVATVSGFINGYGAIGAGLYQLLVGWMLQNQHSETAWNNVFLITDVLVICTCIILIIIERKSKPLKSFI